MSRYLVGFAEPELQELYRQLSQRVPDREIDQGSSSIDYVRIGSSRPSASTNHILQSPELFEILSTRPSLSGIYRQFAHERLPWEPSSASLTQSELCRFDTMLADWRRSHPGASSRDRAERIFQYVTEVGGLGIQIDHSAPELTLDQIFVERRGDCTEFVKLLMPLLSRAGFAPYPVWVGVNHRGEEDQHIVTGLDIDGQTLLLDPVNQAFNAAHQSYVRISLRELLAWHWNNRALDAATQPPVSVSSQAMAAIQRALQVDPGNPHFLTNRGWFLARNGDTAGARDDFLAALSRTPDFHQAQFRLGNLAYDAGDYREAISRYRRAHALAPQESDYQRNLVLALHASGRVREARRQLSQLLERDPRHHDLVGRVGRI